MLIIPDNSTLRSFIPNSFAALEGQQTLFERMAPFLQSAELWFFANFISEQITHYIIQETTSNDEPLYFLPRRIVALRAWINAAPSLDIVISHNGLSVIETNNAKPASKAKIDRLLASLSSDLDQNIDALLPLLPSIDGWTASPTAAQFRATLFPDFSILRSIGISSDLYAQWLALTARIADIEDEIAEQWISLPLLQQLRLVNLEGKATHQQLFVISKIKAAVRKLLTADGAEVLHSSAITPRLSLDICLSQLEEAVDFIRENPHDFPLWHTSHTARRFSTRPFRNKKSSSAYFF